MSSFHSLCKSLTIIYVFFLCPYLCKLQRVPSSYHQSLSLSRLVGLGVGGWNSNFFFRTLWIANRFHICVCVCPIDLSFISTIGTYRNFFLFKIFLGFSTSKYIIACILTKLKNRKYIITRFVVIIFHTVVSCVWECVCVCLWLCACHSSESVS
jgi:hypothetical protein